MNIFNEYLKKDNIFEDISLIILNENIGVPDSVFDNIKKVGNKIGIQIKRSDTIFDYLERAGKEVSNIIGLICKYIITKNGKEKDDLKLKLKSDIKSVNRQRIVSFIMEIDNSFIGLSSMLKLVMRNIFGIEITNYKEWLNDVEYILTSLKKIKKVLIDMNASQDEFDIYNNFYNSIIMIKQDIGSVNEDDTGGTPSSQQGEGYTDPNGATTSTNIQKFYPKFGTKIERRKLKNKKLRKYLNKKIEGDR